MAKNKTVVRVDDTTGVVEYYHPIDKTWNIKISDIAYNEATWNGNLEGASKNALRDKFESLSGGGGGLTWNEVTGTSQPMAVNNGYIMNNVALVTGTLPDAAAVGDVVRVGGKGAGGWLIAQNASEVIHFNDIDTTIGVGGSLASSNQYDAVELICIVTNTEWLVISSLGNITIV